jgi:hypothetical protein
MNKILIALVALTSSAAFASQPASRVDCYDENNNIKVSAAVGGIIFNDFADEQDNYAIYTWSTSCLFPNPLADLSATDVTTTLQSDGTNLVSISSIFNEFELSILTKDTRTGLGTLTTSKKLIRNLSCEFK